jgi:hypothetical protein
MTKQCPRCHQQYSDAFNYCSADGTPLATTSTASSPFGPSTPTHSTSSLPTGYPNVTSPSVTPIAPRPNVESGNRWARRSGEFAARFDANDFSALLNKGVVVEQGTQGILFQNGKMVGVLTPGYHTIQTVTERLTNLVWRLPVTIVLLDASQITLPVTATLLRTTDDQAITSTADVVIALENPIVFFENLMKGQSLVLTTELAARIGVWARDVLEPIVFESAANELYGNSELRERVELDMRAVLQERLGRLGLVLIGVDSVKFIGESDSIVRQRRGELSRQKALAEIDQAYRSFQAKLAGEATAERMDSIKSEADFCQFVKRLEHEVFRRDLLRQDDRDALTREFRERHEDQDAKRSQLLKLVDLQRRTELARLEHDFQVDDLRRAHGVAMESARQRGELSELERKQEQSRLDEQLALRLRHEDSEFASRLRRERELFDQSLDQKTRATQADLNLEQAKQDQELRSAQAGIGLYRDYKSARLELEHRDRQATHELEMEGERQRHQRELERTAQLNSLSAEALIAQAPVEQAALLADLRKTETLKNMDEAQIMALFAKESPDIARALAEKYRGEGEERFQERAKQLYERMLSEKDAMLQTLQSLHRDSMRSQLDLAQTALGQRSQSEFSRPVNDSQNRPQGSSGSTNSLSKEPNRQLNLKTCLACGSHSPIDSRFCHACGKPIAN